MMTRHGLGLSLSADLGDNRDLASEEDDLGTRRPNRNQTTEGTVRYAELSPERFKSVWEDEYRLKFVLSRRVIDGRDHSLQQ